MQILPMAGFTAVVFGAAALSLRADEGMWLYSEPPRAQVQAKYGFEMTDVWLDHLMKASVRFNSGGSGSFVSADGLVITNHHVGADDLQKLSSAEHNYLRDGFYAATPEAEIKCVDLELNVLQSIEDVTKRVNAAVGADSSTEKAAEARRSAIAAIEKESLAKTGLRSDVVTLHQGGAYHLYRYKRYTDVRLVFAPEQQIAFFGGDPDNFEYPRYNLDICVFRAYENGKPAKVENFLRWSANGAADGELTFVSGHPGRTDRQLTLEELRFLRDVQYPYTLSRLKRLEVLLGNWSARDIENARRARDDFFGVQNSRKAYDGEIAALQTPALFAAKGADESALAAGETAVKNTLLRVVEAVEQQDKVIVRQRLLDGRRHEVLFAPDAFWCDSFALARTLLRTPVERAKPDGERLEEYSDAARESFELELFTEKPIYADLETLKLADSLGFLVEQLGAQDPLVEQVLAGKSPRERAYELISGTKVRDVAFRRALYTGGAAAVEAAKDPMIELARLVDPAAREVRKRWEEIGEVKQQAHAALERARFAQRGASAAPDATFTLRLSYGVVKGYSEAGHAIPAFTDYAGLYARSAAHEGREPFDLPQRWVAKRGALDLSVPFNFVTTHDIIGGNSGSPMVNRAGEFVGIIFDGNLQGLILDFAYEEVESRAIAVDSRGIIEALRQVYGVDALVAELTQGKR
ncbi:MAG TPA: S46 family peptidase [Opitutaceae bacterium]|nr:S46 family peptidase [Opitutaceae bacterium]